MFLQQTTRTQYFVKRKKGKKNVIKKTVPFNKETYS